MKITLPITVLAAILGLALAGTPISVQAQTTTPAAPAKPAAPKKIKYEGTLTAVAPTSIMVKETKETLSLAIAPDTKFEKDKKATTLADFLVGDKVTGSYTKNATGTMTASSLHKAAKKAKTPKSNTTAATTAPAAPAGQ